jgi:hypothetical protein
MVLPIYPNSPVSGLSDRIPKWNNNTQKYDSGARHTSSPYVKPLYQYKVDFPNLPRTQQQSLEAFYNSLRAGGAFLFKDPYDYLINGATCVRTGTSVRSFFVLTAEGWPYIPVSGTILITSNLSGALTQGTHFQFDQTTGVFSTWVAPSSLDFWTSSCQYFRKCGFDDYAMSSKLWQNFVGGVSFSEIALP